MSYFEPISEEDLKLILADLHSAWETLAEVAMQVPGAAEIVGPRSKVPIVIDMVFEQAGRSSARTEVVPLGYIAFLKTLAGPAFSREDVRLEATLMLKGLEPQHGESK